MYDNLMLMQLIIQTSEKKKKEPIQFARSSKFFCAGGTFVILLFCLWKQQNATASVQLLGIHSFTNRLKTLVFSRFNLFTFFDCTLSGFEEKWKTKSTKSNNKLYIASESNWIEQALLLPLLCCCCCRVVKFDFKRPLHFRSLPYLRWNNCNRPTCARSQIDQLNGYRLKVKVK